MGRFKIDGFLIALVIVVVAAMLWPEPGARGGFLHADLISTYGVAVVFFLYGLTLAPEKMRKGMTHWRLHLVVQLGTSCCSPSSFWRCTFRCAASFRRRSGPASSSSPRCPRPFPRRSR
jgi:predicted Na+-dependent transporter